MMKVLIETELLINAEQDSKIDLIKKLINEKYDLNNYTIKNITFVNNNIIDYEVIEMIK